MAGSTGRVPYDISPGREITGPGFEERFADLRALQKQIDQLRADLAAAAGGAAGVVPTLQQVLTAGAEATIPAELQGGLRIGTSSTTGYVWTATDVAGHGAWGPVTPAFSPQAAKTFFSGPVSGGAAVPGFRIIGSDDLPIATGAAVGAVKPDGTTLAIDGSGTLSVAAVPAALPGLAPLTTPTSSSFTWVNQGTSPYAASATDANGAMTLYQPPQSGTSDNIACLVQALPAAPPYTVTVAFLANYPSSTSGASAGLMLLDATNKGQSIMATGSVQALGTANWNSMTSYNGSGPTLTGQPILVPYIWIRVQDDGTNRTYWASNNGSQWNKVASTTSANFLTPTKAGVACNAHQTALGAWCTVVHWEVTSP